MIYLEKIRKNKTNRRTKKYGGIKIGDNPEYKIYLIATISLLGLPFVITDKDDAGLAFIILIQLYAIGCFIAEKIGSWISKSRKEEE